MLRKDLPQAERYTKQNRRRRIWHKVVGTLACIVVFCTTYALILPAITLEGPTCGLEEHVHTEECYTQVTSREETQLACSPETLGVHVHTSDCYDGDGNLICGYGDFVVHTHDASCYDANGNLVCQLPEIEAHTHTESCYVLVEGHTHTEECYTTERGELICDLAEEEGHTHSEACYDENDELICQLPETEGHAHTDECYEQVQVLTCELEETEPELVLVCDKPEVELHTHDASCYDEDGNLICGKLEVLEHVHSDACFQTVEVPADTETLTCTLPEDENHTHTALCYGTWELTCGLEEHTHTEECYAAAELTEEEQAQVEDVIATIDAMPTYEEIEETLNAFDDDEDYEGYEAYFVEVQSQAKAAYDAYDALTDAQKEKVTNVDKLMDLSWLWSAVTLEDTSPDASALDPLLDGAYAYVSAVNMGDLIDGTWPFDSDDNAGNDSNAHNGIVRTFDTVTYNLEASLSSLSETQNYNEGVIWFQAELDMDISAAKFDLEQMLWMESYTITYYDKDGKVLDVAVNAEPSYTANANASDSTSNESSYTTAVAKQVITGCYTMQGTPAKPVVVPGTQTLSVGVKVLAAKNDDVITPTFTLWMENNEENKDINNTPVANTLQASVTVSAAARYNLALAKTSQLNSLGYFDLSTGQAGTKVDYGKTSVYGKMEGYAVIVQLYNVTTATDGSTVEDKGLKGIELPYGNISMTITFSETVINGFEGPEYYGKFTPILWDYNENVIPSGNVGKWSRNLYWNGVSSTTYADWSAPLNKRGSSYTAASKVCYDGGTWFIAESSKITAPTTGNVTSSSYGVTVSGYDFDLNNFIFPSNNCGSAGTKSQYTSYVGCFSAGYFEVIMQVPDAVPGTSTLSFSAEVTDFHMDSNPQTAEVTLADNNISSSLTVYAPGSITKYNSFTEQTSTTYDSRFLGTYFWGASYDAAAYAGDTIAIIGSGYLSRSSNATISDVNMLQKFDSAAFAIQSVDYIYNGKVSTSSSLGENAEVTFLYAADPLYPGGWDSNAPDMMQRMNTAKEEDLIYFGSLEDLESAGYTCIGVLMEIRDAVIEPDKDFKIRIIVKVTDDAECIGNTYCTVNTVRAWTDNAMRGVSWINGTANGKTAVTGETFVTNTLKQYVTPNYIVENDPAKGYVKSEFQDGLLVSGTHKGGYVYGMSLLVVGYKSSLSISADQKVYDLDKNQRTAVFTIDNIKTTVSSANSSQYNPSDGLVEYTDLTVTATVQEGLSIQHGTYYCGDTQISTDMDSPTPITYLLDSREYTLYVYAEETSSTSVVFHISNAVVRAQLPAITFSAIIGNAGSSNDAENNDSFTATATISGSADKRAYSTTAGNISTASISVIKLASTAVYKTVSKTETELGEPFDYTIVYANQSNSDIGEMYIYDILPYLGDGRGTSYHGSYQVTNVTVNLEQADATTDASLYYSYEDGSALSADLSTWSNFNTVFANPVGTTVDGVLTDTPDSAATGNNISAIGLHLSGLSAQKKLTVTITIDPDENLAGDIYGNYANTWIVSSSEDLALKTNTVQTVVYARSISGVVWYDSDLDGVQDTNSSEILISGVTCTLFKYNEETNQYEVCTTDVTGAAIPTVITGDDGAYRFDKLAAGDYIVAFLGDDVLNKFTGETVYQVNGTNDSTTNDGVAISELKASGIDTDVYAYAIKFASTSEPITLHTIDEITASNSQVVLSNYVELYEHQDLGLIIAGPELPNTGGAGTDLYTIGGLLLMASASLLLLYNHHKRRKEDFASS